MLCEADVPPGTTPETADALYVDQSNLNKFLKMGDSQKAGHPEPEAILSCSLAHRAASPALAKPAQALRSAPCHSERLGEAGKGPGSRISQEQRAAARRSDVRDTARPCSGEQMAWPRGAMPGDAEYGGNSEYFLFCINVRG